MIIGILYSLWGSNKWCFLIIDFAQNICGCNYYIIHLLSRNYMSLHCSMLSTYCIKATAHSTRYCNWQKMGSFFVQLIGGLQYTIIIGSYMQGVTKWAICCNYHIASNYSRSCINAGSRSISGLGIVCYNNKTHNIALHVSSASIRIHH